jgi:Zn-dependent peptidase ImmA (M78 family)
VGDVWGKPIRLIAYPLPADGPFGAWISTRAAECFVYQKWTSPLHQDHIILHELGHMVAGHESDEQADNVFTDLAARESDVAVVPDRYGDEVAAAVSRARQRTCFDDVQEREAETVATTILGWASVVDVAMSAASRGKAAGIDTAFGDRIGWL